MKRSEEVRRLLAIPAEKLEQEAGGQLKITRNLEELYEFLAEEKRLRVIKLYHSSCRSDRPSPTGSWPKKSMLNI